MTAAMKESAANVEPSLVEGLDLARGDGVHANLAAAALVELALARNEGQLTDRGAFSAPMTFRL